MSIEKCELCDAKIIKYRHSLNKALAKGLIILHKKYNGFSSLNEMSELNFNQKNNFQKLKYWGLVHKNSNGVWTITDSGIAFVTGNISVYKTVVTYRNKTIEFDGEKITIEQALDEYSYWWREQYLENRVK